MNHGDTEAQRRHVNEGLPASAGIHVIEMIHHADGQAERRIDSVVREEPLEIRVRGTSIAVTMRTPGHDEELAAGFLLTEGIVKQSTDIVGISPCLESGIPENTLNVFLTPSVAVDLSRLTRHVFASSSCGLCGKASIEAVHQLFPPIDSILRLSAQVLTQLPERLRSAQEAFARTGGLHAAAIFDNDGNLKVLREDVGRHNAVDKVIGHALLSGQLPLDWAILLVSGRVSFEITQKALAARIPIVAAISAPSSLAIDFAQESRQTLAGFLRGSTFNLYSCPERIVP
jgi:FdhD protein